MPLAIMVKQRSITKLDSTRKQLTTPMSRGRTQFMPGEPLKKQRKRITKSTAANNILAAGSAGYPPTAA